MEHIRFPENLPSKQCRTPIYSHFSTKSLATGVKRDLIHHESTRPSSRISECNQMFNVSIWSHCINSCSDSHNLTLWLPNWVPRVIGIMDRHQEMACRHGQCFTLLPLFWNTEQFWLVQKQSWTWLNDVIRNLSLSSLVRIKTPQSTDGKHQHGYLFPHDHGNGKKIETQHKQIIMSSLSDWEACSYSHRCYSMSGMKQMSWSKHSLALQTYSA